MSQASTGGTAGKETTMGYGRCVGRVGALAVATRMTVSIGVAVLVVMSTVVPGDGVAGGAAGGLERAVYGHRRNVRLDHGHERRPDARRLLRRVGQEPVHRADPSRPDRLRQGDDARGVVAPRGAWSPRLAARARHRGVPGDFRAGRPSVGCAVVEPYGALRPHPQSVNPGTGSPIWSRRSPSTPTTIG